MGFGWVLSEVMGAWARSFRPPADADGEVPDYILLFFSFPSVSFLLLFSGNNLLTSE